MSRVPLGLPPVVEEQLNAEIRHAWRLMRANRPTRGMPTRKVCSWAHAHEMRLRSLLNIRAAARHAAVEAGVPS